jgi:hypothetical protein
MIQELAADLSGSRTRPDELSRTLGAHAPMLAVSHADSIHIGAYQGLTNGSRISDRRACGRGP